MPVDRKLEKRKEGTLAETKETGILKNRKQTLSKEKE